MELLEELDRFELDLKRNMDTGKYENLSFSEYEKLLYKIHSEKWTYFDESDEDVFPITDEDTCVCDEMDIDHDNY